MNVCHNMSYRSQIKWILSDTYSSNSLLTLLHVYLFYLGIMWVLNIDFTAWKFHSFPFRLTLHLCTYFAGIYV